MVWVIPTQTGVVLVDAGMDTDAVAVKAEIGDRKVHAILVTHGHFDHIAALSLFPEALVYVGPGERPLVRSEASSGRFVPDLVGKIMKQQPYTPPQLQEFTDGQVLDIDGESFQAVHVKGHTVGGAIYIWNNVLFSGDMIVGRGDKVNEIPRLFYTDYDAVRSNIAKALDYEFDRMADGHTGLHENVRVQVETYVNDL